MNDKEKINLLKDSLDVYIDKWKLDLEKIILKDDVHAEKEKIRLRSMKFMAQWIINSINGGLERPHGTNICKIILLNKEEKNYE
jgi:hypothetical protein